MNSIMRRHVFALSSLAVAIVLTPCCAVAENNNHAEDDNHSEGSAASLVNVGRTVRVVSLGFIGQPVERIVELVDQEGARGADLIVLPETWTGYKPESLDGPLVKQFCALARKHRTYIVNSIYRLTDEGTPQNSAILIDREGKIAGVYDKAFPYWAEFDALTSLDVGDDAPVFETDFGRVGFAICFDVNFPEVWSRLADNGAELVVWPSAYSAGRALQAHALNHHYYIVTATWRGDCQVYDITGERLIDSQKDDINVVRVALDLDRRVYHTNFNEEKLAKLLAEHGDDVVRDVSLEREQWFVLKAKRPGVDVIKLAREYGLEEFRDYIARSRAEMDARRRFRFVETYLPRGTEPAASASPDNASARKDAR